MPDLYDGIMRIFSVKSTSDRWEAVPLPVAVWSSYEKEVISAEDMQDRLFVGAILLSTYASLRFSGARHLSWDSIVLDDSAILGIVYRSKMSVRSSCFGFAWG